VVERTDNPLAESNPLTTELKSALAGARRVIILVPLSGRATTFSVEGMWYGAKPKAL
jgi:hypothetical protein